MVDDDDFDTLEVEPLEEGPDGNRGFLAVVDNDSNNNYTFSRDYIVSKITEMGLLRPDYNKNRNS